MKNKLIPTIALVAALSSTGCFTLVGATIGSISDSGKPKRPPPPPPPAQLRGLPPGSYYFSAGYAQQPQAEDNTGMSGAGKGALAGLVVDGVIVTLLAIAIANMDFGGGWGGSCYDGC